MTDQIPKEHLAAVTNGLLRGQIIPFFGAGANLCGQASVWEGIESSRLPSGHELSKYLATAFSYPADEPHDLARVSQYADTMEGRGPLFGELHSLFEKRFSPTELHTFFANVPRLFEGTGYPRTNDPAKKRLTIVTTNYDDVMECAFREAQQKFHVISYVSELTKEERMPLFLHWPPDGDPVPIRVGNSYAGLNNDSYPVLLKIHGAVDKTTIRTEGEPEHRHDSFVITEDHYIDYLSFGDVTQSMPMITKTQLITSNFLFLGHGLHDWTLRAFLRRIWRDQRTRDYRSWAVLAPCSEFEKTYWAKHNVGILETDLALYTQRLNGALLARLSETA